MPKAIDLSVVVPVYYAEKTLDALVDRLSLVLNALGKSYEILLVDDGSRDESWRKIEQLNSNSPKTVFGVRLTRNYGQHNATMCGLRHARGEIVVTLDDDLQNPPEEIPRLIQELEERSLDVVYGVYDKKQHSWWRNLGSGLVSLFYRWVFRIDAQISAFRAIRSSVAMRMTEYNLNFTYLDGLIAWNTDRIGNLFVQHAKRTSGQSGYSLGKLLSLAFNMFCNFSVLPLQMLFYSGLFIAGLSLSLGLGYLYLYFAGQITVAGYTSLMISILFMGGIQLIGIGLLGEYLGRLHISANRKPQYQERTFLGPRKIRRVA